MPIEAHGQRIVVAQGLARLGLEDLRLKVPGSRRQGQSLVAAKQELVDAARLGTRQECEEFAKHYSGSIFIVPRGLSLESELVDSDKILGPERQEERRD